MDKVRDEVCFVEQEQVGCNSSLAQRANETPTSLGNLIPNLVLFCAYLRSSIEFFTAALRTEFKLF